jgi:hypothetical protein
MLRYAALILALSTTSSFAAYSKSGCAWRKAAMGFVKVYEICLHSGKGDAALWEKAFESKASYNFKLSLDFHYNVGGEKTAKSFEKEMNKHAIEKPTDKKARADFLEWLKAWNVPEGSNLTMTFDRKHTGIPARIDYTEKGKTSTFLIHDLSAAYSLANIYLGGKPFKKSIKRALLGVN